MKDLTGLKIGNLIVIRYVGKNKWRDSIWRCLCICGNYKDIIRGSLLKKNPTKSCGQCLNTALGRKLSFLEKVKKEELGCWEWQNCKCSEGYGSFWNGTKLVGAHIFSYELHIGNVPKGINVCHHCDNPGCVNPSHLFLGTQLDNVRDMYQKGRQGCFKGSKNGAATITEEMAKKIINELFPERGYREIYTKIAKKLGVSLYVVKKIANYKTWKHLPREVS